MEIDPRDIPFGVDELGNRNLRHSSSVSSSAESATGPKISSGDTVPLKNDNEVGGTRPYHNEKWARLSRNYKDQYLDLLKDTYEDDIISGDPQDLLTSQIGAVRWNSDEKKLLFVALAKYGRHNLPQIQSAVATKSILEIAAYLDALRTAYIERQKFAKKARGISFADIPAAVEIGMGCEADLEKAADALSAYQEQYDITAGRKAKGSAWLIDHEVALKLDDTYENTESDSGLDLDEDRDSPKIQREHKNTGKPDIRHLFKLSTFLDLSECFFMNHDDQTSFSGWRSIAEPGQRPALTDESVQTFSDLLSGYLRCVLKLSIQIATTRISSMSTGGYSASRKLGESDVTAALDILNLPHDSWDFWTRLARRNNFQIITGSHNKGESRSQIISYDQAEAVLSQRRGRGRRRSMSVGSETSSAQSDHTTDTELVSDDEASFTANNEVDSDESSDPSTDREIKDIDAVEEDDDLRPSGTRLHSEPGPSRGPANREARRLALEEASHEYADSLDKIAQAKEETKLMQILGKHARADTGEEDDGDKGHKFNIRPKTLRKTQEEIQDWSCTYMAEWEMFGSSDDTNGMQVEQSGNIDRSENDETE